MAAPFTNALRTSTRRIAVANTFKPMTASGAFARPAMAKLFPAPARVGFHTTKKMQILPAGPQVIEGDVNQPTTFPDPNPTHGSYHWSFERLISVALVPLTIAPFAAGSLNPITDAVLGAAIVIHSHIGFEACVIDYFPKRSHPGLRKLMTWLLRAATATVAYGLYEFETNDVGITEMLKRIWTATA